jgi:alkanesulfonate monooxygenase SsuD/methylene tetrahydromethanopterin reductase-like flavin-dependent oxidoreductase (luciferase family)
MPPAYNHPARVAERIATLDLVSNGRVEWGTGESASHIELGGFGVDPEQKREMWEECTREVAKMMVQTPYAGFEGKYFSMPPRNVLPKPVQKPHPPIWVACPSRDTMRYAARNGMGALTFAFVHPDDAKFWVEEYYEIAEKECQPIGQAVNLSVAMVSGFSCHEDEETAIERGLDGLRFFTHGLSHYYVVGDHIPGHTDVWESYKAAPEPPREARGGIGTPDQLREHLLKYEEMGVDQVVFIQQAGRNRHEDICEALELLASRVMPEFKERDKLHRKQKLERLAPIIEAAESRIPPLTELDEIPTVTAYPALRKELEGKPPEEAEMSEDGKAFLLAIEGGQRVKKTASQR